MVKYYRIALFVAVAIILAFIAKDQVSKASSNTALGESRSVQPLDQPAQLQPPIVQVQQEESASPPNQSQFAQVEGLIWNDLDRDGLQDLGENGILGVTVNLYNNSKALVGTSTTDGNGLYRFQNLSPGDYYAVILLPVSYVFSPKDQGVNELVDSDTDPNTAETNLATLIADENDLVWTTGLYSLTAVVQSPGTVQPPPPDLRVCDPAVGVYSLGGVSTLRLNLPADDYCLHVFLWNHAFSIGRIPGGAGRVLAEVTFLEAYYQERFVYKYEVAGEAGSIQVCYAVPIGMQAQIYFFDFYGPMFGEKKGQPSWELLQTTVENGIACAPAQTSGAYALIGK
jgi:hypothetical protein